MSDASGAAAVGGGGVVALWAVYILGSVVELMLLVLIVGYAWTWPKSDA